MHTTADPGASREGPGHASPPRADRAVSALLILAALAILVTTFALAIVHLSDRYGLNSASSVWIGLADYAREGTLFPPVFDGQHYAGTRYMPVPVVLHAGLASLTGEYLVSGKLLGLVSILVLGTILFVAMSRERVSRPAALALTASALVTPAGLVALLAVRPEGVATALQLGALVLIARSRRPEYLAAAIVLCVVAVMAKFSAVYAPVAIVWWLLLRERRTAFGFSAGFVLVLAITAGGVNLVTDGRMVTNLLELGVKPPDVLEILKIPANLMSSFADFPTVYLLAPFAIASFVGAGGVRGFSIYQMGLLVAMPILLVLYTDPGVWFNHLLDVVVLVTIAAGTRWTKEEQGDRRTWSIRAPMTAALVLGAVTSVSTGPGIDLALAVRHIATDPTPMFDPQILDPYTRTARSVLTDDAFFAVSIGKQPIILDSFVLPRIAARHPDWLDRLAARVRGHEFDLIVLQFDVSDPDAGAGVGPHELDPASQNAIRSSYQLTRIVDTPSFSYGLFGTPTFFLYEPN